MPGPTQQCPLVAIGGSAGSLEALIQFFEVWPDDCGMAFIVVVHLAANEESLLPELLQRRCALTVLHAHDAQAIQPNHVYVIPPGRVLRQQQRRLSITMPDPLLGRVAVIDVLFSSVADDLGGGCAGILLSGADSDGTAGLLRISQAGGLVLVQDPAEAPHETMPRAAMASGCADDVLCVAQMPAWLLGCFGIDAVLRQPPPQSPEPKLAHKLTHHEAELVSSAVLSLRRRTGHDFSCFRQNVVLRHLRRRMDLAGMDQLTDYLARLASDPAEPEALIRELLVSVTSFFRDPDAFGALARQLPQLFKDKDASDFVRVWVPACASGEEAYSIAMLLLEHAHTLPNPPGIQVFGSDLDKTAIERARAGLYRAATAEAVGPMRLARFFHQEQDGYRVCRELRQIVLFAEHDVVHDPAFTRIDLVSCRNLFIYLNRDGQRRMIKAFDFALAPHGLLLLGMAEGLLGLHTCFVSVERKYHLYRRDSDAIQQQPGVDTILRSLAMEQTTYGEASRLRAGPSVNQLQHQLALLQQRLQGSASKDGTGAGHQQLLPMITQELHATLEELEINRQELRSMNAELSAVNLQLSGKLDELEQTNSDLNNLMNAAAIPMVFLNRELRIMRYTPRALDLFRLIPSDLGRQLSDLRNNLAYPELMDDALRVLGGADTIEREVREQSGKWFFARVLPYYALQNQIGGVVLTFFDITERRQSEAALKASEEKLRTFISATSEIVYEMSADWLEMRSLAGKNFLSNTEIPRVDWSEEYIPEVDKPRVWETIQQAIRTRSHFELEHRVVRMDSSTGWVFSRAIPLLDEKGAISKWFGAASDITERKRYEVSLHESEAHYRTLFNSIDEGFCVIEVRFGELGAALDYRFLQVNQPFEQLTGIKEAVGRWMREIAPQHEDTWFNIYGRVVQTREPVRFEHEARALGRVYDVYAFPVGAPQLCQAGVLFNAITERRHTLDALRASESRLRLTLDAAGMGSYAWYAASGRIDADTRLLALFGLPAGAQLADASAMNAMLHCDDRERYDTLLRQALDPAGNGAFRDEVRVNGADGVQRRVAFMGQVEFDGKPRRAVRLSGVARAISP
ncbi:PAS domain-containing protein [Duganella sp. sic0402]|uniref:chemotaxis protein CheB n=1 Tax=Duganella sp. sic0402 TaxID=2854786 RepID=UPI001C47F343|nr:chemotaxis protein CheB [Duganella sp. sic0402]MBV7538232.1 PAS domain-containing protein [Duganella sp. sic0402]